MRIFLSRDGEGEKAKIKYVPVEEAARFLDKTENPFKSCTAHPDRGTLEFSCDEIKAGPDANHTRHLGVPVVAIDPFFLFGAAKGDKDDIGPGFAEMAQDFGIVHVEEL